MSKKNRKKQGLAVRLTETGNQNGGRHCPVAEERTWLVRAAGMVVGGDNGFDEATGGKPVKKFGDYTEELEGALCRAARGVEKIFFAGASPETHEMLHDVLRAAWLSVAVGRQEELSAYAGEFTNGLLHDSMGGESPEAEDSESGDDPWVMQKRQPGDEEPDEFEVLAGETVLRIAEQLPGDSVEYNRTFLYAALRNACIAAIHEEHEDFARHVYNYMCESSWYGGESAA